MMEAPIYVIGGVNMDLSGTPFDTLRKGDSNPGHVRLSPGGVGRNIAENLCRLGRKVFLVTIMGADPYADVIRKHCRDVGIDLTRSFTDPLGRTSVYLCVNEQNGDLNVAVSDMAICDELTPGKLETMLEALNQGGMVVVDANLPGETLEWIAEHVTVPIAADPVSVSKAARLKPLLPRLALIKPNLPEAELLTGMAIRDDSGLRLASRALHDRGVERVYISLGERGVWADDARDGGMLLSCPGGTIVNTTGCGDAFVAAAADAYLKGLNTFDAARRAAAALCAGSPEAVSPELSPKALE